MAWCSFDRFERLLANIDDAKNDIAELIPSAAQKNVIRRRKVALADFKSVTLALQAPNTRISESHALFQSLVASFPDFDFRHYLRTRVAIIHSKSFETSIIKVQNGKESELDEVEKDTVR